MASSSDRDEDSKKSQSKEDNPFIRFRQFADSQVSSFLQGVIGLPSTFSRRPDGTRTHWDIIDEDLRRRDELQARQKELKEAQFDSKTQQDGEEVAIPVKKSSNWGKTPSWSDYTTNVDQNLGVEGTRDVPFYSPVTKWMFAHLQQQGDPNVDWQEKNDQSKAPFPQSFLLELKKSQMCLDAMKMTQYAIYNDLNSCPTLRSDFSILPYLMFSPYSPLQLSVDSQKRNSRMQYISGVQSLENSLDSFPYTEAFEDLLRTQSQLPPRGTPHRRQDIFTPNTPQEVFKAVSSNISWITSLYFSNLLQEKETRTVSSLSQLPSFARASNMKSKPTVMTEQDMYDEFLRWGAPSTAARKEFPFVDAILSQIDQLPCSEFPLKIANEVRKTFSDKDTTEAKKWTDFADELKEITKTITEEVPRSPVNESTSYKSLQDPERITSSSTTTIRRVHGDGIVETSVTVRKVFADGKSTTTTTEHFEEPAGADWDDEEDEERRFGRKVDGQDKKEEKKKNGWFWN